MKATLSLLLLLTYIQSRQGLSTSEVLDYFRMKLNIETLIVFANNATREESWEEFAYLDYWPKVVLSQGLKTELRLLWGANIVSFVFADFISEWDLEDLIKPSLINLHLRDIFFYSNATVLSPIDWHWLFEWCWLQGFWHVLLVGRQAQHLLTMDPLPAMAVKSITLSAYFEERVKRHSNLQGFPVRVTVGNNPPRAQVFYDACGQLQFDGVYGHALKIFAAQFNASLHYVVMPDMASYSLKSCIDYIKHQETDVCGDIASFLDGIATTRSQMLHYGRLLVPYDSPLDNFHYFLMPYTTEVWCIILLTFSCMVMLLSLLEFKQQRHIEFSRHILTAFQSFIYISFRLISIPPTYRHFLESVLIFCGFTLTSCYLAVLSSILLTRIYHRDIRSFKDVIERQLPIPLTDYDVALWNTFGAPEELKRLVVLVDEATLIENRRLLNENFILWALDGRADFYLYQQKYMLKPVMKKLDHEVVIALLGGVPMRAYWPFQNLLEDFMDNLFSSGIMQHINIEANEEGIIHGQIEFFATEVLTVEPLSMEYFQVCILVLAVGYGLSLVCFLLEIVVARKGRK